MGNEWIRCAATGDSNAMLIWVLVIAVACGGIITSIIMLLNGKNDRKQSAWMTLRNRDIIETQRN